MRIVLTTFLLMLVMAATIAAAQTPVPPAYQPKFAGDKARSDAEFSALGFIRTARQANILFQRKHGQYADSLRALIGSGSFTRRMANSDRGDYTVSYRKLAEGYSLTLVPKQYDSAHRAFYLDQTGEVRAEEDRPATKASPPLS